MNAADRSAMNPENVIKPGLGGIAYSTYGRKGVTAHRGNPVYGAAWRDWPA